MGMVQGFHMLALCQFSLLWEQREIGHWKEVTLCCLTFPVTRGSGKQNQEWSELMAGPPLPSQCSHLISSEDRVSRHPSQKSLWTDNLHHQAVLLRTFLCSVLGFGSVASFPATIHFLFTYRIPWTQLADRLATSNGPFDGRLGIEHFTGTISFSVIRQVITGPTLRRGEVQS